MTDSKRIDGKRISSEIIERVKYATFKLLKSNVRPGLAVIIVGDDPASKVYVSSKSRRAEECGFLSHRIVLPEKTTTSELLSHITSLNFNSDIHGILVQLPLPSGIDENLVTQSIDSDKDVDGFHYINVGKIGIGHIDSAFVPCTPAGSMILLRSVLGDDLSGKSALVIGRSNIVGKPMANLLLAANATVTVAHSRTENIEELCRASDIVVAAVGRPLMVKGDWIKEGATVIDVGINRVTGEDGKSRLVGDVDYDSAIERASHITPVPGGVGPMTIALLMANTLVSAYRSAELEPPTF